MRINKFLARAGLGSRRYVEKYIKEGTIEVNGNVIKDFSINIDPKKDIVKFKNRILNIPEKIYLALNKPPGYLVTTTDPFNRKTIFDLLPNFKTRIFPVGRLDKQSSGLLLLTNDGDWANLILKPNYKFPKTYIVQIKGKISKNQLIKLRTGVKIDNYQTQPAKVYRKNYNPSNNLTKLKIVISEGKKRQIRKMIKETGSSVYQLKRVQIGKIKIGNLAESSWRYLKDKEINYFRIASHS